MSDAGDEVTMGVADQDGESVSQSGESERNKPLFTDEEILAFPLATPLPEEAREAECGHRHVMTVEGWEDHEINDLPVRCTRPIGHDGDHEEHGGCIYIWPRTDSEIVRMTVEDVGEIHSLNGGRQWWHDSMAPQLVHDQPLARALFAARNELASLRERVKALETPDMWWDAEEDDAGLYENPQDLAELSDAPPGSVIRCHTARHSEQDRFIAVIPDERDWDDEGEKPWEEHFYGIAETPVFATREEASAAVEAAKERLRAATPTKEEGQ